MIEQLELFPQPSHPWAPQTRAQLEHEAWKAARNAQRLEAEGDPRAVDAVFAALVIYGALHIQDRRKVEK